MLVALMDVWRELPPKLEEHLSTQLKAAEDIGMLAATYRTARIATLPWIANQAFEAGKSQVDKALRNGEIANLSQLQRAAEDAQWSELEDCAAVALEELVLPRTLQAARETHDDIAEQALEQYMRKRTPAKSILAPGNVSSGAIEGAREKCEEGRLGIVLSPRALKQDLCGPIPMIGEVSEHGPYDYDPSIVDSALIKQMQEFVDETYTAWGGYGRETRTRDRHNTRAASRIEVVGVEHLQNDMRYMIYCLRRQVIEAELATESREEWDVKTDRASTLLPLATLDSSLNEHYLWHGTGPTEARGIASTGFDLSQAGCGRGALFGRGAYFAESCLKADEYVKPDERGWYPLILCRVTLGRICYCDAEDPGELRESLRAACRNRAGKYHSVLGDREKVRQTFREFVLFDSSQVYPEFIVWYVRN
jgi:hypothetical protein